jgi:hypothetical protein
MKRLCVILFVFPIFAQNQWGSTEVQDPCNNQEYLIFKEIVDTKGTIGLTKIVNGVVDYEKMWSYRIYEDRCNAYQHNPCGFSEYLTLKKKGVLNLTSSEFEIYKIFENACAKQESAKSRGQIYQYIEGDEWTGGKYQKSNPAPTVPQEPIQTKNKQESKVPVKVLQELLNIIQGNNQDMNTPSTPSLLQTHLCQFDNYKLFTNGKTKYGQNATKFRLWICPLDNSHVFWIAD